MNLVLKLIKWLLYIFSAISLMALLDVLRSNEDKETAFFVVAIFFIVFPFWLARRISSKTKVPIYSLRDKGDALTFITINLVYKETNESDPKELAEAVAMLHGMIGDKVKKSAEKAQKFIFSSLKKDNDTFDVLCDAVNKVNEGWSLEEKQKIIEGLLDIAFADGKVNKYEALLLAFYEANLGVKIKNSDYQEYVKKLKDPKKQKDDTTSNKNTKHTEKKTKRYKITYRLNKNTYRKSGGLDMIKMTSNQYATSKADAREKFKKGFGSRSKIMTISKIEEV